jgi:two-component system, NarL family, nitrate/nitrite response regulator NarL
MTSLRRGDAPMHLRLAGAAIRGTGRHGALDDARGHAAGAQVALIGGSRLLRETLGHVLSTLGGASVLWTEATIGQSVDLLRSDPPQILVFAPNERDEYGALPIVRRIDAGIRIVVIGDGHCPMTMGLCAESGVLGYLSPDASAGELLDTLERVSCGELSCPPDIVRTVFRFMSQKTPLEVAPPAAAPDPVDELTQRERDVVGLMAQGLSNKQIAHRLSIEVATVKSHVHRILAKLNLERRAQVVALVSTDLKRIK